MKIGNDRKIEDILLEANLITFEKLNEIKRKQIETGEKIEKLLLSEGLVNYREILAQLAIKLNVDFVDLENLTVNKDALKFVSEEVAKRYSVFPFDIQNNLIHLAMQNPDDVFIIDEIKVYTQTEIVPFLGDGRLISHLIKKHYSTTNSTNIIDCKNYNIEENKKRLVHNNDIDMNFIKKIIPQNYKVLTEDFINKVIEENMKLENVTEININPKAKKIEFLVAINY